MDPVTKPPLQGARTPGHRTLLLTSWSLVIRRLTMAAQVDYTVYLKV